jgi:hypothetical protein
MYPHLKIDKRKVVSSFDCVGFTYLKALKHGGFEKVRLAPNALYPEKPVREFNPLWRREARLRSLRNHIK